MTLAGFRGKKIIIFLLSGSHDYGDRVCFARIYLHSIATVHEAITPAGTAQTYKAVVCNQRLGGNWEQSFSSLLFTKSREILKECLFFAQRLQTGNEQGLGRVARSVQDSSTVTSVGPPSARCSAVSTPGNSGERGTFHPWWGWGRSLEKSVDVVSRSLLPRPRG